VQNRSRFRGIAIGFALLFAVAAMAASGETDDDSGSDDSDEQSDDVSQGAGSADASADVSAPEILREGEGELGISYGQVTITNNSSERSDYFVTIVVESPDGATRHDETIVTVMGLEPGQATTERGAFTKELPADAVAKVIEVQRTASV